MNKIEEIIENTMINLWTKHFRSAPYQINKPHESDAELIEILQNPKDYLAVTIDTVAEEITEGLYQEPYTMGWVTIMASLSDLAAVGAEPLGLLISTSVESFRDKTFIEEMARGMEDACRVCGTFILGGDTNSTSTISMTACAFGVVPKKNVMMRSGCKAGDVVFVTNGVGQGNALGLVRLAKMPEDYFQEKLYQPVARLKEGQLLREYASCCMDTSDGLLATLDQLMRINGLGFVIECHWQKILTPEVWRFCEQTKTPHWLMIAGPHGEFELLFTIPAEKENDFIATAQCQGVNPIRLGKVQQSTVISLILPFDRKVDIDVAPLRNLWFTTHGNLQHLLQEFKSYGEKKGLIYTL